MKKILFLIFILFIAVSGYSQKNYKTITGKVIYENGTTENRYSVTLIKVNGDTAYITLPDNGGNYEFRISNDYSSELCLYLGVKDYLYQKKTISFPLKNDLHYDLRLIRINNNKRDSTVWKSPDNIIEKGN